MKFTDSLLGRSSASLPSAGRFIVESVLTVTTGVFVARLAWLIISPQDAVSVAVSPAQQQPLTGSSLAATDLSALTRVNAFAPQATTIPAMEAIPVTTLNLRLVGLRAVSGEGAGSATVELPDGRQARFSPGDEILAGVRLEEVATDRVVLRHGAGAEVLLIGAPRENGFAAIGRSARPLEYAAVDATASSVSAIAVPASQPAVSPAALLADTTMQPETREGIVVGYKVAPKSANGAFASTGLMQDDMVLRVNNIPVEGLTPDRVYAELTSSPDISLDVVRQGAIVRIRLAPSERPGQ